MKLTRIETPGIAHYAWLIADGIDAALVDPRRDVDDYLAAARAIGVQISHVIETHLQEDFVMGAATLARLTGAVIVNGRHERFGHGHLRLADGEWFDIGELRIRALHTPGHTLESMSYAVYTSANPNDAWCVFTGDTLFFGVTGRTDLTDPDKTRDNAALLYDAIHDKLAGLGDTALVLPAHGPGSVCGSGMAERPYSTIGEEKRYNEAFTMSRDAFINKKCNERLPRPPYFSYMEQVNLKGGLPPAFVAGQVSLLDAESFDNKSEGGLIVDTREPEAYAGSHMHGSHSIWLSGLPVFGGWIAAADSPVYLVTDRSDDIDTATRHLARIGIDDVRGALAGGFGAWRKAGGDMQSSGVITPRELQEHIDRYVVLDVRDIGEFESGHIDGAHNVYVGHLAEQLDELAFHPEQALVVTCSVGHRASLGVSILLRHGFGDVRNLLGGMTAWKALGLPVTDETAP